MPELQVGSVFAGHRIEGIAGRGGMGVVYRATHLALDHVVAMKVISAQLEADEVFRERFRSESRIAVSIRHPNVVAIHHAGEEDGLIFVTMDLIEGTDLRKLLNAEGKLAPERAIDIVSQAAAALDAAHSKGLVHRDVKPGNILIEDRPTGDHAYLTDFGLTKRIEATSGVTATGAFVGTLDYVAPEQIKGQRTDARTDVYALGCVLFECLTGEPPFASQEDKVAKIYAHLQEDAPPLLARGRGLPEGLDGVVARALAKEPDDRYPSAGDLARAARAALEYRPVTVAEHGVGVGAAAPDSEEIPDLDATQPAGSPLDEVVGASQPAATAAAATPASETGSVPSAAAEPLVATGEEKAETGDGVPAAAGVSARSAETLAAPPPPRESRLAKLPGVPALILGAATIVVAVVVISGVGSGGSNGTTTTTSSTTSGGTTAKPPPPGVFVDSYKVGGTPVEVADGLKSVWVTNRATSGQVFKVDPNGGRLLRPGPIAVGSLPEGIATGAGRVWVANAGDGTVQAIDPSNGTPGSPISVGSDPRAVTFGAGSVWVANSGADTLSRIDPSGSGAVDTSVQYSTGSEPHGLLVHGSSIYVVNRSDPSLWRINIANGTPGAKQPVGNNPKGVAYADGKVWVTNTGPNVGGGPGTVSVLNADTLKPDGKPIDLGTGSLPRGIVFDHGSLWVAEGGGGAVAQINPANRSVHIVKQKGIKEADGIAAGPGGVWTANGRQQTIARINPTPTTPKK